MRVILQPAQRIEPGPSLFAPGMPWLRAAEAWAAARGERVERSTVDQRVQVGGHWYAVAWNEHGNQWEFTP